MPGNTEATVYIGNLDERVDERLLYEIMVQAGPLVEVYIPRDKETKRHKGFAFSEYRTEESALYALSLFSGLVSLYNRSLRFAISGGEKSHLSASGADNGAHRFPHADKSSQQSEQLGPATPSRNREINGYPQQISSQNSSPHYYPSHSPGYGGQGLVMADNLLTPSTHAQYNNAHLTQLSQWGGRSNSISHGYTSAPSYSRLCS